MRNLLIICLFTVLAAFGCHKAGPRKTIVAGHIDHVEAFPNQNTITLKILDYGRGQVSYTGNIDKKGNFKIEFNQYFPEDVSLTQNIWAGGIVKAMITHPGDSIHVDLDYKDITNVKFTGDAAETNTDLYTYITGNYSLVDMQYQSRMFKTEKSIRELCTFIKKDLLDKRKEFIAKEQPNEEVQTWTLHDVELRYYVALVNMLNDPHNPEMGIFIVNKTVNFGKDVNEIYDTHLLNSRGYALLPALVPGEKAFIKPGQKVKNKLLEIEKSDYNPLIKEMLTGYLFRTTIAQRNIAIIDQNRAVITSKINEPFIREPLMLYYSEMKQTLVDPSIATDDNYKPTATMLDTIIVQNTGKVIYVDLWATWCGPCRAEMPNAEKLKSQYKNKGVVFAAICLDGKKDEWQRLVADMKLSPGQYYSEGTDAKKIGSSLHLQGYPHYLIVNRAGKILSNGDGFRPADPLTAKTIDKLLD